MKRILLVEDEKLMQELVYEYLLDAGYEVITADDGVDALEKFRQHKIDLVILDIMMPKLDGFSVCRKIRSESEALIIMLTAREDEDDKLLGYELGADDYVTKPFSPKVLVAKVNKMLSRFNHNEEIPKDIQQELTIGHIVINPSSFKVVVDNTEIKLNKKEFDLLYLLARHHNKALNREVILNSVWGDDYYGDGRVLDTNIKTLRKKLGDYSGYIKTIVHVGYKLEVE